MEMKHPTTQLENSRESLASRRNQAGDRIPGLKNKVENMEKIRKENEKFKEFFKALDNRHR